MVRKQYVMQVEGGYIKYSLPDAKRITVVKTMEEASAFTEGIHDKSVIERFVKRHNIENYKMLPCGTTECFDI